MSDLEARLIKAAAHASELGELLPGMHGQRLLGKAEGIRLALSYLRDGKK